MQTNLKLLSTVAVSALLTTTCAHAQAVNGTWTGALSGAEFTDGANWSSAPDVPNGVATFSTGAATTVTISSPAALGAMQFNTGAPAYTFDITAPVGGGLTLNGLGIVNNSSNAPTFNVNAGIGLALNGNGTTAGNAVINNSGAVYFAITNIAGDAPSTAGQATITNNSGGATYFYGDGLGVNPGSTAGNATIINIDTGLTQFANNTTAGSANIKNNSDGLTVFGDNSTAGSAHIINDNGATVFEGDSTVGTATITNTNGGYTRFINNSTAGTATINNNAGGYTNFEDTKAGSAIINNDGGRTDFFYSGSADNATITSSNSGSTYFHDNSTAADATIITNDGGATYIAGTASGGAARFITNGTGLVDFSGLTSGGTTAGSIEGSGTYYLGANTLTVGSLNTDTLLRGTISDGGDSGGIGGSLVKVGTGALELAGTNTYTGDTTVSGGTLNVTGSIESSSLTTVNSGAMLTGTGIVGNTTIVTGGIFAPGNGTPGTAMTVNGNLTLQSGAQYVVNVNQDTSTYVHVTGTANLGGATLNANYANGSYVNKSYTILTADHGWMGTTFNGPVNTNLPANFSTTVNYDPTNVYLVLTLNYDPNPDPDPGTNPAPNFSGGLNRNQRNVANTLVNFFNTTGGIPLEFGALAPAGLTQVSGELATRSQQATFTAMDLFTGLLTDPHFNQTCGELSERCRAEDVSAIGYAAEKNPTDAFATFTKAPARATPFESRWRVWGAGFGGSQTTSGNAATGSNDTRSAIYGVAVGADYLFSPDTLAGFALAGGGTNFSVNGLGSGRSDLFQAGAYMRHNEGPAYITGALAWGWQDITTNRTVTVAGLDQLRGTLNANAWSGRLESGYRFVSPLTGGVGITPYAAARFTTFDLPGYAEQVVSGAPTFALNYAGKSVTDTRSELGLRTDKSFVVQDGILTLRTRFAWAHNFDTDNSIAATFQTLPGTSFVVNGASMGANSALITASAEMTWRNGWSTAATFDGEFSDVSSSYAGKGVVRYRW